MLHPGTLIHSITPETLTPSQPLHHCLQSLFFKSLYKPPADAIKIAGAASGRHAGVPRDGDASSSTASSSAWDNMDEDARVVRRCIVWLCMHQTVIDRYWAVHSMHAL